MFRKDPPVTFEKHFKTITIGGAWWDEDDKHDSRLNGHQNNQRPVMCDVGLKPGHHVASEKALNRPTSMVDRISTATACH